MIDRQNWYTRERTLCRLAKVRLGRSSPSCDHTLRYTVTQWPLLVGKATAAVPLVICDCDHHNLDPHDHSRLCSLLTLPLGYYAEIPPSSSFPPMVEVE